MGSGKAESLPQITWMRNILGYIQNKAGKVQAFK